MIGLADLKEKDVGRLVRRILAVNFAAIHTTSGVCIHSLARVLKRGLRQCFTGVYQHILQSHFVSRVRPTSSGGS